MVRFSILPMAAAAMLLFGAEASPCRPSTTRVTSVATTTTQAGSTTTTAAPGCVETQLFVNPGFDDSAASVAPWTSNGALIQSETQDGANALAFTFTGGGQGTGIVKQSLSVLAGIYEFSYYYRVLSVSVNADYTCDIQLSMGDTTLRGSMEDGPGGWKPGSVLFPTQSSDLGTTDVQFTVSCSGDGSS
ncbi:uncharacterized protein E0L32_001119 [Thyridium curvatum]|uniref:Uncharacterized protein n=1 Tax=Thyridium curvatum TaxID=1093900 RepID=A0A507B2J8_9PEZI|nr:uncharacterized protein E0L32_001119 [Thyridium curvatum]TPX11301.1 hypothetical protein E0L32_001119 [Thyridium curvatum]